MHAVLQGGTKVALYGLGNVRDERLGRMFLTPGSVEWWGLAHCYTTSSVVGVRSLGFGV